MAYPMLAILLDEAGKAGTAENTIRTALVSGIVSILVTLLATALGYRTKVDEGLRDKRLELYRELWQKTALLPMWPRGTGVTYQQLKKFSEELRSWYFDEGGIFLSRKARKSYGKLQQTIEEVLTSAEGPVHDPDYDRVRSKCSDLRSQLTKDLSSRRTAHSWF